MKRLKIVFVLLFLAVFGCLGVACQEEDAVRSISLSMSKTLSEQSITYSGGEYNITKGQSAKIDVVIKPDSFKIDDLEWASSDTAIVYVYKGQISAVSEGVAMVFARYAKNNVTASIKVRVNDEFPQITFGRISKSLVYNGLDQKEYFKADQEGVKQIVYTYYDYQNPELGEQSADRFKIKDAGTYKIIAKYVDKPERTSNVDVTITPYVLSLSAKNYEYVYGEVDEWPEKLFSTSNLPSNILDEENAQELLCGIGEDVSATGGIGKFIETTAEKKNSNVGSYVDVGIKIALFDDYQRNYASEASVVLGRFDIKKKDVVLVVDDQEITYGGSIASNKYKLYSYIEGYDYNLDEFGAADLLAHDGKQLVSGQVEYMANINLGKPSFFNKNVKVDVNADELNVCLDEDGNVITYALKYENWSPKTANLNVKAFVNAKLLVNKRNITITPIVSQQKSFLVEDPKIRYQVANGNILQRDLVTLKDFLFVNYDGVENGALVDYKTNSLKSVGEYFYIINNTKNTNYNFALTEDAIKAENPDNNEGKIKFVVNAVKLELEFNDVEGFYKTLSGNPFGYYGDEFDFKTTIKHLKFNGVEAALQNGGVKRIDLSQEYYFCASADFNESGIVLIKNREDDSDAFSFKFNSITLSDRFGDKPIEKPDEVKEGFYCYYYINGVDFSLEYQKENFELVFARTTTLNLKKINIIVSPVQSADKMTKVFDGTDAMVEGFGTEGYYELSSLDVDLSENPIDLAEILKEYGTENDFNVENCSMICVKDFGIDVKNYGIELAELEYKDGFEFYNFVLDNENDYSFRVLPCEVVITPKAGQEKVYGCADNEGGFEYEVSGVPLTIETNENGSPKNVTITGKLGRVAGEDAYSGNDFGSEYNYKEYEINLGDLSFGDNYTLTLNASPVCFTIKPREVSVTPLDYVITYGEQVPSNIRFEVVIDDLDVDETILVGPSYVDATFAIDGSKVGSYYPVKIDGGNVTYYDILRGSFNCNGNYYVTFTSGKLTVNKKQAVLNMTHDQLSQNPTITNFNGKTTGYTLSGLVDSPNTSVSFSIVESVANSGVYIVDSSLGVSVQITKGAADISDCYDVILGNDIVYVVNKTVLNLKIVDKNDSTKTSVTKIFDGTEMDSDFVLFCENSDYEVVTTGENKTKVTYKFLLKDTQQNYAQNVGTYVVGAEVIAGNSDKIVIRNTLTDDVFTFNSLSEVVGNCVLNIVNVGALTITKASITVVYEKLAFDGNYVYGNDSLNLDIATEYDDHKAIFLGVDGNGLTLKTNLDTGRNYTLEDSYDFNKDFKVGVTQNITVIVEAESENYDSQKVVVPLNVSPRPIECVSALISKPDSNIYNGQAKTFSLTAEAYDGGTPFDLGKPIWDFERIETEYTTGTTGQFKYYEYSGGMISGEKLSCGYFGNGSLLALSSGGKKYFVLNNSYAMVVDSNRDNMLIDAGMYVAIATYSVDSNYMLMEDGEEKGTSISYGYFYEIEKSGDINISGWKEEFEYGTRFDFSNPSSLPFEFSTTPAYLKDEIVYMFASGKPIVLDKGSYSVNMEVNNANYYYSASKNFKVKALPVEVFVPSVSTYGYVEGRTPLFLQYIRAEYERDGELETEYYDAAAVEQHFTLKYYNTDESFNIVGEELAGAPGEIGFYKLKLTFAMGNYYGEGEYNYVIKKQQYYGYILFEDYETGYDHEKTKAEFYNEILTNMFRIDDDSIVERKTITCNVGGDDVEISDSMSDEDFKKVYNGGRKLLTIVVEFEDHSKFANKVMNAYLTIAKFNISANTLEQNALYEEYDYSGMAIYNELMFKGLKGFADSVALIPYLNTIINETNHKVVIDNLTTSVYDKLGNLVFVLTYTYSIKDVPGSISYPINPNNYVVTYSFSVGESYSASAIISKFNEKEFRIKKIDTLYVSFDDDYVEIGPDYVEELRNKGYVLKNLRVSSSIDGENMFYTLDVNNSGAGYNVNYGVCLVAIVKKGGEVCSKAETVGTYQIELTLRRSDSYVLSQYFNKISFNGVVVNVSDLTMNGGGEYEQNITRTFMIY